MKKNFLKILEFFAAIILSAILFPIALIYNILKIKKGKNFLIFVWKFIIEVFKLVFDLFEKLAIIIDRLGNVICGNMFIDIFVLDIFNSKTLFNKSEITISAAFGHAQVNGILNAKGKKFIKLLSKIFGSNHAKNAYKFHLIKKEFHSKTGIS